MAQLLAPVLVRSRLRTACMCLNCSSRSRCNGLHMRELKSLRAQRQPNAYHTKTLQAWRNWHTTTSSFECCSVCIQRRMPGIVGQPSWCIVDPLQATPLRAAGLLLRLTPLTQASLVTRVVYRPSRTTRTYSRICLRIVQTLRLSTWICDRSKSRFVYLTHQRGRNRSSTRMMRSAVEGR